MNARVDNAGLHCRRRSPRRPRLARAHPALRNSCGRNVEGTKLAFAACWLVGIVASSVLALPLGHGLLGIWWGNAAGLVVGGAGLPRGVGARRSSPSLQARLDS
jgi:hypothetical protein